MTIDRLITLSCEFFGITETALKTIGRSKDKVTIAKHCVRTLATEEYGMSQAYVNDAMGGGNRSNIVNSRKVILEYGQFKTEYDGLKSHVLINNSFGTQVVTDRSGIERVTNEAFDERFYKSPNKINPRTNNEFFPAFHHITKLGSPEPIGLTKWRQDKGHFADYIMVRSQEIGSFVHDCIDRMIKSDTVIKHDDIHEAFTDPKEAQRVKDCLLGFMNLIRDEEPVILASEQMMCGIDFGFTLDSRMLLKSDEYKNKFVVDWKTSKVANEDHKMQLEAMRRVSQSDKGAVVVLGNSTKKKYTMTIVKPSEQDHLWNKFQAVKETAYVEMIKRNSIAPREDNMPQTFDLRSLKFKRQL